MKKMLGIVCAAALVGCAGCKSVPSVETMYATSYMIGISAGMVANETKIDDTTRNTVVEVLNIVSACIPETNQTFEVAWTPIAQAHVDKLVAEGKINAMQGQLVMSAFTLAAKGLDYVFEVRFPEAKQYKELVVSAMDGAINGFLSVFKPVNKNAFERVSRDYDKEAYEWLKANR